MLGYFAPLAATLGPVALMAAGGYFATRHVRPENRRDAR